jgi:hypothetical protein
MRVVLRTNDTHSPYPLPQGARVWFTGFIKPIFLKKPVYSKTGKN